MSRLSRRYKYDMTDGRFSENHYYDDAEESDDNYKKKVSYLLDGFEMLLGKQSTRKQNTKERHFSSNSGSVNVYSFLMKHANN